MKTFATFMTEAKLNVVEKYKVGKTDVEIHSNKGKFIAHLDGEKLDTFKTLEDAESGVKEFFKLLGKK